MKLLRRSRDPCRQSEQTAKAVGVLARYIFYFAANVRRIRRAGDERECENLPVDDVIFVTIAPATESEYFSSMVTKQRREQRENEKDCFFSATSLNVICDQKLVHHIDPLRSMPVTNH